MFEGYKVFEITHDPSGCIHSVPETGIPRGKETPYYTNSRGVTLDFAGPKLEPR